MSLNQLDKTAHPTTLKKTGGGGGTSGAPATVDAPNAQRIIGGVPVENLQAIFAACLGHIRGRGELALHKALQADDVGDSRLLAKANQELADVIGEAGELSNEQQRAKLVTRSRRTVDRDQIGAWYAHLEGR